MRVTPGNSINDAGVHGNEPAGCSAWRQVVLLYAEQYFLSPREIDVLGHAVEGAQDKHIAERHSCSRSTVSTYWRRIFIKTGVRPQREVLAHLLRFACTLAVAPQPKRSALGVSMQGARTAEID